MSNQHAHGLPLHGEQVVAADAIAKLASIDLHSTIRVMTAIHALRVTHPEYSLDDLLDHASLPTAAPDTNRWKATEDFLTHVVHRLQKVANRPLADALRINKRFQLKRAA